MGIAVSEVNKIDGSSGLTALVLLLLFTFTWQKRDAHTPARLERSVGAIIANIPK